MSLAQAALEASAASFRLLPAQEGVDPSGGGRLVPVFQEAVEA
jgi:hypothetical protein